MGVKKKNYSVQEVMKATSLEEFARPEDDWRKFDIAGLIQH